ncbi:hypothetical protein L596_003663 [Steinernema carpocapsae]|uniref:Uncharacterized protein n=1 Tax=Steinernema carpocapsae TaxID=34508 RepID=A0A4U8UTB5_STECR|nr:hypothetical protein L596_003663 [Steinernema carpocapsae]
MSRWKDMLLSNARRNGRIAAKAMLTPDRWNCAQPLKEPNNRGHSLELPTLARLGKGQTLCDKSKVIVCRVLQFARANCGQNAVEWTSSVTGIRQTLRTYEQETDIHLSVTSVEEGILAYKLPPCSTASPNSFKDRVVDQIDEVGKLLIEEKVDQIHRSPYCSIIP